MGKPHGRHARWRGHSVHRAGGADSQQRIDGPRKIWEMQTNSGSVSGWNNSDRSGSKWPSLLVGFGPFLALVGSLQILGGFFLRVLGIIFGAHRQVVFVHRAVALAADVEDHSEVDVRPDLDPFGFQVAV